MALRAGSASAYVELSIATLLVLFPALVLGVLAIVFGVWLMLVAQLANMVGAVLVAHGFWRNDGRMFDSVSARAGLALLVAGSIAGTAVLRLGEVGPRVSEEINAAIPNVVILTGLVMLAASNYLGPIRRRMQLAALCVIAPGAAASVVVAFVNAAALSGIERAGVMLYVLPAAVLAWACYSIAGRPEVFNEADLVEL